MCHYQEVITGKDLSMLREGWIMGGIGIGALPQERRGGERMEVSDMGILGGWFSETS